ncbi:MAG: hypothetical protein A3F68_08755 [Acidobacteria bacterium RIFCSPLOWO2_12_FULL_54_10]|nr:MAG: hypothetical protein A3F68_08755 [Acidobacteria bacterium RIFCSPLOWO2_12_FULL_54_10]
MTKEERLSYMILFCGLLLVKQSKAAIHELSVLLPARGKAMSLAARLAAEVVIHDGCSFDEAGRQN